MSSKLWSLSALATLVVGGALAAAGCTSATPAVRAGTSSSSTSTTSSATSLPVPIQVGGTDPTGPGSFLGPVLRVDVIPVPAGQLLPPGPPAPPPGSLPATTAGSSGGSVVTSTTLPRPSVTIGYRQFGSGPDLLLVAGQDASMGWWPPSLLSALAQNYHVTIFDLPSVGYSGQDDLAPPSVDSYADLTAGLIDALGLKAPVVLGWGLGGETALAMQARHPGVASSLVVVDSSAGGPQGTPPAASVAAQLADPTETAMSLGTLLFGKDSLSRRHWFDDLSLVPPDDVLDATISEQAAVQAAWWRQGLTATEASRIAVPVLVIEGEMDAVFPPANAAALAALLPTARTLYLAGAAYASIFADAPAFLAALKTFTTPA